MLIRKLLSLLIRKTADSVAVIFRLRDVKSFQLRRKALLNKHEDVENISKMDNHFVVCVLHLCKLFAPAGHVILIIQYIFKWLLQKNVKFMFKK